MRHFIVNHTGLYGEPGRTTNSTVAEWKEAIKTSFGITYYNDMLVEILQQYATFYWVYELQEQYMYGSSRTSTKLSTGLGSVQRNLPLVQQVLNSDSLIYYSYTNDSIRYMERGQKKRRLSANRRKLSNHTSTKLSTGLGNVLAVVSDRKLVHCSGEELMWFEAQVVSVTDYYPFGMEIRERTYVAVSASGGSVSSYRYGFGGYEKDDEWQGSGNSHTTEFRQYDTRLGRWMSKDPKWKVQPEESPYNYVNNMPIVGSDKTGEICVPCLIILAGLFTAPEVVVAPTKDVADNFMKIEKANELKYKWLIGAFLAGGASAGTLSSKAIVQELKKQAILQGTADAVVQLWKNDEIDFKKLFENTLKNLDLAE